jgi:acetyl esterase
MEKTRDEMLAAIVANRGAELAAYAQRSVRGERAVIPTRDGDLPVIIYRAAGEDAAPVFFNMHGGGFVFNDAVLMDAFCDDIRRALNITVVNVNYRKAPEHPFPAALHDVYDVVQHVHDHATAFGIDPERMAIGGHSAGGNLAAAACLLAARQREFAFRCQVLDYPFLDMSVDPADKPGVTFPEEIEGGRLFNDCYCPPSGRADPLVSPICADAAELAGLPPAVFVLADIDGLRDEAERYACGLLRVGVPVWVRRFAGALHGFVEVNTGDYAADPRQSAEQAGLAREAVAFIHAALKYYLTGAAA